MLIELTKQCHWRIVWGILILAAISCSTMPNFTRQEQEELEFASVSNEANRKATITDLSINPVHRDDDLLFFAYDSEWPFAGFGIQIYSSDSKAERWNCVTCDMEVIVDIQTLAVRLPPSVSKDRSTLTVKAGIVATDETFHYAGLWLIDIRSGAIRILGEDISKRIYYPILLPDARKIAGTTGDGTIVVIDIQTEEILHC